VRNSLVFAFLASTLVIFDAVPIWSISCICSRLRRVTDIIYVVWGDSNLPPTMKHLRRLDRLQWLLSQIFAASRSKRVVAACCRHCWSSGRSVRRLLFWRKKLLCTSLRNCRSAALVPRCWYECRCHEVHALIAVITCIIERLFSFRLAQSQALTKRCLHLVYWRINNLLMSFWLGFRLLIYFWRSTSCPSSCDVWHFNGRLCSYLLSCDSLWLRNWVAVVLRSRGGLRLVNYVVRLLSCNILLLLLLLRGVDCNISVLASCWLYLVWRLRLGENSDRTSSIYVLWMLVKYW